MIDRRSFLVAGAGLVAAASVLGGADGALAAVEPGPGPYGPLSDTPDANGLFLPAGFTSRVIGVSGETVAGTSRSLPPYVWHNLPDGGATFPGTRGGWVYASNAEMPAPDGGAGAVRFAADGSVLGAYPILTGTGTNCAGGPTPWGAWLSCEERDGGHVWECDPSAPGQGIERPRLGTFHHEAAAVDPVGKAVYLTEDDEEGRLYRFLPDDYPDLSAGRLQAAIVDPTGAVTWKDVSPDAPDRSPETTVFQRGEGMWAHRGRLLFVTTTDTRIWLLHLAKQTLRVLYDGAVLAGTPLTNLDTLTVHPKSSDVYVAEDGGNMELCMLGAPDRAGVRTVTPVVRVEGPLESELAGPAFNPAGDRLVFSSQRGTLGAQPGAGITFEVHGPFRSKVR